jgi:RES domain-containing protein
MVLWRISGHKDLNGAGGLKAGGRWHEAGQPVVYLSESPAAALLEICVHTAANDIPPDFILLKVEGPDVRVPGLAANELPKGWQNRPELTRGIGMKWLRAKESVLLKVPSAIIPETSNFLFNPAHADAKKFRVAKTFTYPFDARIKK